MLYNSRVARLVGVSASAFTVAAAISTAVPSTARADHDDDDWHEQGGRWRNYRGGGPMYAPPVPYYAPTPYYPNYGPAPYGYGYHPWGWQPYHPWGWQPYHSWGWQLGPHVYIRP